MVVKYLNKSNMVVKYQNNHIYLIDYIEWIKIQCGGSIGLNRKKMNPRKTSKRRLYVKKRLCNYRDPLYAL